jgi:hypothetical protein
MIFKPEKGTRVTVIKKRTTAGLSSQEWLNAIEVKKERNIKNKIENSIQTFVVAFEKIAQYIEFLFWRVRHWPFLRRRF